MLAVEGLPIVFLELAIGQRLRKGAIGVWAQISPYLGGIGIASTVVSFNVALYYNTIIAWCLYYLFQVPFWFPLWSSSVDLLPGPKTKTEFPVPAAVVRMPQRIFRERIVRHQHGMQTEQSDAVFLVQGDPRHIARYQHSAEFQLEDYPVPVYRLANGLPMHGQRYRCPYIVLAFIEIIPPTLDQQGLPLPEKSFTLRPHSLTLFWSSFSSEVYSYFPSARS